MWFKNDEVHVHLFVQAGRNSTVTEVSNWVASMSEEEQQKIFEEFPDIKAEWHEKYDVWHPVCKVTEITRCDAPEEKIINVK